MKKFKTIDELHQAIEKKVSRTIKYYYTDWKNYDRLALMKATGEKATVYIILRECGSYLYTAAELINSDLEKDFPGVVMNYYTTDKTARYYKMDLKALTLEEIPAGIPAEIKAANEEKKGEQAA